MNYKIVKHCMYPLFSILSCKHGMYLCKNNDHAFCGVFENFTSEEYILNNFRTEMSEMGTGLFLFNTLFNNGGIDKMIELGYDHMNRYYPKYSFHTKDSDISQVIKMDHEEYTNLLKEHGAKREIGWGYYFTNKEKCLNFIEKLNSILVMNKLTE